MADERILNKCSKGRNGNLILSPIDGLWADCPCLEVDPNVSSYEVVDDFIDSNIGDVTSKWMLDNTNGTVALGSAATYGLGGMAIFNTGATDEDWVNLKAWDSDNAGGPFKITANSGKKLWFEAKFYLTAVGAVEVVAFYVGLMDGATTEPMADATGERNMDDGIYFRTLSDASTELDFARTRNTTEAEIKANIATLVKGTFIRVGFRFDGASTIVPYINGVAYPQYNTNVAVATFPYDVGLTPYVGIKTTEAVNKIAVVDWIKCIQMR